MSSAPTVNFDTAFTSTIYALKKERGRWENNSLVEKPAFENHPSYFPAAYIG